MTTSSTPRPTTSELIDSRPLTGHQKNLIALVIVANISEFFDLLLIGFVVSLLTEPWNLTGFEAAWILGASGAGTVLGAILWGPWRTASDDVPPSSGAWCCSPSSPHSPS